ncbi:MAG TPA: BMP family ABC transporter substrate-binding protein [Firmicutes bacterium]|jgi:basic membrane protein A|nr:BMP family ABC transporter substrate-binding protein [Bacillota bacterium]
MKRTISLALAIGMLFALVVPVFSAAPPKVAIVFDIGGLGDQSFNDAANRGRLMLEEKLGAKTTYIESRTPSDYEPNLAGLARQGYDVIWGIGFMMSDAIKNVSQQFPNTKFGIIDNGYSEEEYKAMKNVLGVLFKEQEGSFLVGVLAALTTKTNIVGFVGGMDFPVIERFESGFKAGVWKTNPKIKILTNYTGTFNDAAKGKIVTMGMYLQNADVVFHAAGQTGLGTIEAAVEQDKWAIGVDSDQNHVAPNHVLNSMIKRVEVAVFEGTKMLLDPKFASHTVVFGIKEDGVGLAPEASNRASKAATAKALEWAEKIRKGEYVVPEWRVDADKLYTK